MSKNTSIPVIILAFANDVDAPLRQLAEEQDDLIEILAAAEKKGRCKIVTIASATPEKIISAFQEYRERVKIFHYGGHSNQDRIFLKTGYQKYKGINASDFAEFIRLQKGLELIFLNSCLSLDQAKDYYESGIKTVIATNQNIEDKTARKFSSLFYNGLVTGANISQAFLEAEKGFKFSQEGDSRGQGLSISLINQWEIFPNKQNTWTLPRKNTISNSLKLVGLLLLCAIVIYSLFLFQNGKEQNHLAESKSTELKIELSGETLYKNTPKFPPNDSTHFNILILRFEYLPNEEKAECIGLSIEEKLNVINSNEDLSLPLRVWYVDSIPRPKTVEEAVEKQKQFNADLIIYGLAKNVEEGGCGGADICFRYNIAEEVVSVVSPAIEINTYKHDLSFFPTSPMEIEAGRLNVNQLSLQRWITALINVKAKDIDDAYLELDKIANDPNIDEYSKADRYKTIAQTYENLRKYDSALKAYEKALGYDSTNSELHLWKGLILDKLGSTQLAIETMEKSISLGLKDYRTYANLAFMFLKLKRYNDAVDPLLKAIPYSGDDIFSFGLYSNLGTCYMVSGKYDLAIENFTKAINCKYILDMIVFIYRGQCYLNLGKNNLALKDFKRTEKWEYTEDGYNEYLEARGSGYFALGKLDLALRDFNMLINKFPSDPDGYSGRGYVYLDQRKYQLAIDDLHKSISLGSPDVEVYFLLGRSYAYLDQFTEAIKYLKIVIEKGTPLPQYYSSLGAVYYRLQDYKNAYINLMKAVEMDESYRNDFQQYIDICKRNLTRESL